jgi:hypothetical protein
MKHQDAGHCLQSLWQLMELLRHHHHKRQCQDNGCGCHGPDQLWPPAHMIIKASELQHCLVQEETSDIVDEVPASTIRNKRLISWMKYLRPPSGRNF